MKVASSFFFFLTHIFAMVVKKVDNKVKGKGQDHQGGRTKREDQHMVQVVKNDGLQKDLAVFVTLEQVQT